MSNVSETPYQTCERLMRELHDLELAGQFDSPEAEARRVQAEAVWSQLNDAQRYALSIMSTNLAHERSNKR